MWIETAAGFGSDIERFAALGTQLGQQSFTAPVAVNIGRVEEIDAPIQRAMQRGEGILIINGAPLGADCPGAEANRGHLPAGTSQFAILHDDLPVCDLEPTLGSSGASQGDSDVHCTRSKGVLTLLIAQLFFDDAREISDHPLVPIDYAAVRANDVNGRQGADSIPLGNVFASQEQTVRVVSIFHHRYGIVLLPGAYSENRDSFVFVFIVKFLHLRHYFRAWTAPG